MSKIKRVLVLCLIFLLSINSFATSVNNNDGSAFITKAEFDALKSGFQSQIDTYNQGIDSKIDTAIASYLSGIKISNEQNAVCNVTEFIWPLRVISKLKCAENIYPAAPQTPPLIKTTYDLYINSTNRAWHLVDYYKYSSSNVNDIWLGGYWNSGLFYVTGFNSVPTINIKGMAITDHFGLNTTGGGTKDFSKYAIFLDWENTTRTNYTRWDTIAGKPRDNYANVGQKLHLFTDHELLSNITKTNTGILDRILFGTSLGTQYTCLSWSKTQSLDTWPSSATGGAVLRILAYNTNNYLKWSFDTQYNGGIKYVYNNSDLDMGANAKYFVAPSVDNNGNLLWLTNIKNNREVFKNPQTSPNYTDFYNNDGTTTTSAQTSFGIAGIVSTGLNIFSKTYSGLPATSTGAASSAVETSNLCYNFKKDDGSINTHKMVNGIPIYSFAKNYNDGLKELEITLNIKSEEPSTETNQKYICFGTKPILKTVYGGATTENTAIAGNADLLAIGSGGDGAVAGTSNKLYKIKEGVNTFKLTNVPIIAAGDVLYMKIYFADTEQWIDIVDVPNIRFKF